MLGNLPREFHGRHFFCRRLSLGNDFQFFIFEFSEVWLLDQHAAENPLELKLAFGFETVRGKFEKRRFFFAAKISFALESKPGAAMHSTNSFATSSAVAASTSRLNASTPPKAETGSDASALRYASRSVDCSAVPQGLLCLMMTAAGFLNSAARLRAASRSKRLLYESSFPCSCFAAARPSGVFPEGTYSAAAW